MARNPARIGCRTVSKDSNGRHQVCLVRDTHWDEWRVELYTDGEHVEAADYHADSKQDALGTMDAILARAVAADKV